MTRLYTVWIRGGQSIRIDRRHANKEINEMRWKKTKGGWERRAAGISLDETWDGGDSYQHNTLQSAVTNAIPSWEELGLSFSQAALICFETDLVLSVEDEE